MRSEKKLVTGGILGYNRGKKGAIENPEEYPQQGADILITGTFETYQESGDTSLYCRLQESKMEVVKSENVK